MQTEENLQHEQLTASEQERRAIEARRKQERRGWFITWSGVAVIVLVTALITFALQSGDDSSGGLAAGGPSTYRAVTTFSFEIPGQGKFELRVEVATDAEQDLSRVLVQSPDPTGRSKEPVTQEMILTTSDVFVRFGPGFPRPQGVAEAKQWARLSKDDGRFAALTEGITPFLDSDVNHPAGYLENIEGFITAQKEAGTEVVNGVQATIHELTLDTDTYFIAAGIGAAEVVPIVQQLGDTFEMKVWIDGDGTLRRSVLANEVTGGAGEVVTDIFDIGTALDIEVPAEEQVLDLTAESPQPETSASQSFGCTGQTVGSPAPSPGSGTDC